MAKLSLPLCFSSGWFGAQQVKRGAPQPQDSEGHPALQGLPPGNTLGLLTGAKVSGKFAAIKYISRNLELSVY